MSRRSRRFSRRTFLRGAGGAALGLPLLSAMTPRRAGAAAGQGPKRLIIVYTPNGTIPANFWPTGSETNFQLSPILAPLAAHQQDLIVLSGVDMLSSLSGPGDAHQKGTGQCLTATELQEGDFPGDAGLSAGWANGISVDQRVAQALGAATPFPSLEFGVAVAGADVGSRISYRGPGQPLPPENSPYAMYDRIFRDSGGDDAALAKRTMRRRAVLDSVFAQYASLRNELGTDDRQKVDNHVASLEQIEASLDKAQVEFGGECQPLDQGDPIDVTRVSNMPVLGQLQMDLLAMALACDATRVATLMWTRSAGDNVYGWLGSDIREGHHSLAHKGDEDAVKVEQNTRINIWYAEQLAYLIDKLKAIPEGEGTVFDNTVILWTNEQAKGNNHDRRGMPYLLAGSACGHFRTGRYVTLSGETGHNKLMVSLLHAMDVDDEEFGNPAFGTGPISGLT